MKKTTFWHALNCLAHPISITALLVVAVNNFVLQINWPSWWTGKLGDAAWLVFSPFLVASVVIWLLPLGQPKWIFPLSLSMVCAGFVMVKSMPEINSAILAFARSLGLSLKLVLDPTDLVVLPLVFVSWWIWRQEFVTTPGKSRVLAVLALSLIVTVADSAPPPSNCLFLLEDNSIVAKTVNSYYRSRDGGVTWAQDTSTGQDSSNSFTCSYMDWPVTLNTNPAIVFYYNWDQGLYQTTDRGKTLTLVHIQPGITTSVEYAIATPFDTLIIARGNGSFATRLPDGKWLRYIENHSELSLEQVKE